MAHLPFTDNRRRSQGRTVAPTFAFISDQFFFSWIPGPKHTPSMRTGLSVQLKGSGSATPSRHLTVDLLQLILRPRDILVTLKRLLYHLNLAASRHENGYIIGVLLWEILLGNRYHFSFSLHDPLTVLGGHVGLYLAHPFCFGAKLWKRVLSGLHLRDMPRGVTELVMRSTTLYNDEDRPPPTRQSVGGGLKTLTGHSIARLYLRWQCPFYSLLTQSQPAAHIP